MLFRSTVFFQIAHNKEQLDNRYMVRDDFERVAWFEEYAPTMDADFLAAMAEYDATLLGMTRGQMLEVLRWRATQKKILSKNVAPNWHNRPDTFEGMKIWMPTASPQYNEGGFELYRDFQILNLAKKYNLNLSGLSVPDALKRIRELYPEDAASFDKRYDPELMIGDEGDDFDWWNNDDEDEEDDDGPQWVYRLERPLLKHLDTKLELLELMFADHVYQGEGVFAQFSVGRGNFPDFLCVKQRYDGEEVWTLDLPVMKPDHAFLEAVIQHDPALGVQSQVGETIKQMNIAVQDMADEVVWLMIEQLLTVLRERVK